MGAQANVTLTDATPVTPVDHTFAPAGASRDVAMWEDRSASQYIGFNKLTFELRRPTGSTGVANRNLKAVIRLETPKLETVSNSSASGIAPAPTISYRPQVEVIFTLPERCQLQDRKDLLAMFRDLIDEAATTALIETFDVPY